MQLKVSAESKAHICTRLVQSVSPLGPVFLLAVAFDLSMGLGLFVLVGLGFLFWFGFFHWL